MPRTFRVGAHFDVADPFWVLVREGVYQRTQPYGIDIIPIDADTPYLFALSTDEQISLISGEFIVQRLAGRGGVLVLGGGVHGIGGDGKSRVAGMSDALRAYPQISTQRLPRLWTYEEVCQQLRRFPWPPGEYFDAVFGLSDPIALATSEVGCELGLIDERTIVVGINGDPLALAAIVNGTLTATVQTSTGDLAQQAVDLACQAARKEPLPTHTSYKPTLVTAENVSEIAARKLVAMASLPGRLIGDNTRQAQLLLSQLETSLKINQQVGAVLDRRELTLVIANLIRISYGYDVVRLYLWDEATHTLNVEPDDELPAQSNTPLDSVGLLAEALGSCDPIFVPDARHSHRFPPDPAWPDTRSRVVVPVRLASNVVGLLDLHSFWWNMGEFTLLASITSLRKIIPAQTPVPDQNLQLQTSE